MSERFPSPSNKVTLVGAEKTLKWFLNNRWVTFRIGAGTGLPAGANLIGHVVMDDHLEELYQDGDQFYRHAGGGRGFYWTQELTIVD